MALLPYPGFIGGFNTSRSPNADCQRLVNWYEEFIGEGAKVPNALYCTPGLALFATAGIGPIRAEFFENDIHVVVSGSECYKVSNLGVATLLGRVLDDGLPATISSSGGQLFITSGTRGYIYTVSSATFVEITDANFLGASAGLYIAGYFLALVPNTRTFINSSLNDGLTWSSVVNTKSLTSDNIQTFITVNSEIWLIGEKNTEVWYVTGDSVTLFAPRPNTIIEYGTDAPGSVVKLEGDIYMLSADGEGNGVAVQSVGYDFTEVSTFAVATVFQRLTNIGDAIGAALQMDGHPVYQILFPTDDQTWRFDKSTKGWYEVAYWNQGAGEYEAHLARTHAFAFKKHIVGSRLDGKLYHLSTTYYDDAGALIRRSRRAPHLSAYQVNTFFYRIQIDLEAGVALSSGQGSNPLVMLRWSNDGGKTWSSEYLLEAGAIGQYKWRCLRNRLGSSRDRVFEISVTDPIPWNILQALLDAVPGVN